MDLNITIPEIETQLKAAGKTVNELCREAEIDRATWQRWKRRKTQPGLDRWKHVVAQADRLIKAESKRKAS